MRPVRTIWCSVAPRLPLLVQIHGEERGTGIEHARQGSHQGRQQSGHHDAAQPGRQHVLHHQREGGLHLVLYRLAVDDQRSSPATLPLFARAKQIKPGMMNR